MKLLLLFLFAAMALADEEAQKAKLNTLAQKLYEVEDKVDHLLFHFSHDVTKHKYQATPFGTFLAPDPKNPNSIHQKLKLVDYLNHQRGHPATWQTAANNAYNMGMGVPNAPLASNPAMGMGMGGAMGGAMGMGMGMGMNGAMGAAMGVGMGGPNMR